MVGRDRGAETAHRSTGSVWPDALTDSPTVWAALHSGVARTDALRVGHILGRGAPRVLPHSALARDPARQRVGFQNVAHAAEQR
jgi:hypothetical protein